MPRLKFAATVPEADRASFAEALAALCRFYGVEIGPELEVRSTDSAAFIERVEIASAAVSMGGDDD
jgi:hypothetical protein